MDYYKKDPNMKGPNEKSKGNCASKGNLIKVKGILEKERGMLMHCTVCTTRGWMHSQ